jgi:hypothetical protein
MSKLRMVEAAMQFRFGGDQGSGRPPSTSRWRGFRALPVAALDTGACTTPTWIADALSCPASATWKDALRGGAPFVL